MEPPFPPAADASSAVEARTRERGRALFDRVTAARDAEQTFTIDVLGEACLSDEEAFAYQRRYLTLIEQLGGERPRWAEPPRALIDAAPWGPLPRINISVKLSALHPYLDPIDPGRSSAIARERLRPILR